MPEPRIGRSASLSGLTEAELTELARLRDPESLREIMRRNSPKLYRLARSVLRNESEAEDVLQETYLRAFQGISEFRGSSTLSTWLTRIALNEALGRLRRSRSAVPGSANSSDGSAGHSAEVIPFPTQSAEADPEMTLARKQVAGLLEAAIDGLPDPFRVVFVLRSIQEMSVEETAQQLELPEATVRTRLHRARLLLRKSLEAEFGSALGDAFPFAGRRCNRISDAVISRMGLSNDPDLNI
jgi:RNA polymerase sigma-70 factor (ECF subfamily)